MKILFRSRAYSISFQGFEMSCKKFWSWYDKNKTANLGIAALLFALQLVHLYWLTTNVLTVKLFDKSFFQPGEFWQVAILIVDYLEIPAIITTSLFYLNELRIGSKFKNLWFLFFINSQWLHILWITDEFILGHLFNHQGSNFPLWLATFAILIDYLELPVIFDTLKKFSTSLRQNGLLPALEELKED